MIRLTKAQILFLHSELLRETGGTAGLRDEGLLESAIATAMSSAALVCVNAMMADTIEYGDWKTGQRNEAMITATRCFVTKCVAAIVGAAILTVIGLTGMDPRATVQAPEVLDAFRWCHRWVETGVVS